MSGREFTVPLTVLIFFLFTASIVLLLPARAAAGIRDGFILQGHRGARDARPENTLHACAYAMEVGVDAIEVDVHLTADGKIVISHDRYLNPLLTKDENGKWVEEKKYDIAKMTLQELKKFDLGEMNRAGGQYYELHGKTQVPILPPGGTEKKSSSSGKPGKQSSPRATFTAKATFPSLEELFELIRDYRHDKVIVNIEVKSYADPARPEYKDNPAPEKITRIIYDIIKKYKMENRVIYQSFDWRVIKAMKELDPSITTAALTCEQPAWGEVEGCYRKVGQKGPSPWMAGIDIDDFHGDYVKAAHKSGADIVAPYWEEISPELVREAHSLGMKVACWTVNDPIAASMLIDMGVDSIITDRPWMLREVMARKGMKLPKPVINKKSPYHTGTRLAESSKKKFK